MPDKVKRLRNDGIKRCIDQIIAEAGASPPPDPRVVIKRKTAELASMMAHLHGGEWVVKIDHDTGLLMIARRPRR